MDLLLLVGALALIALAATAFGADTRPREATRWI